MYVTISLFINLFVKRVPYLPLASVLSPKHFLGDPGGSFRGDVLVSSYTVLPLVFTGDRTLLVETV